MPEHQQYHDESVVNPETHHETSDVNVRALLWFVIIFVVFAALAHVLIWVMFRYFRELARGQTNAPLTAIARPVDADIPSLPRLQPFPQGKEPYNDTPVTDLQQMREHEEQVLDSPAWIDKQQGVVRLPIDVAKRLAVQHGFPVVNQ
ncbi:MAG TPA: hypothetical protein VKH35_14385 [Thermoanaerobaculia bacterium]|jgi:hypothetical protein|nr:hypothetical protein [Thermoanaerobaculia bacterium]